MMSAVSPDPVSPDAPFDRRSIPAGAVVGRWRAPDGWDHRSFAWDPAGAPRGSLLFQGGRGDIFEKYLEAFDHWRARGWTIRSFDWRGQGGSGRLGRDAGVGHAEDFAGWIDDLAAYASEWMAATPAPHVIVGHSMGGHLVLRALMEKRVKPDAAVLSAPMLGLRSAPFTPGIAGVIARGMTWVGRPDRAAWKSPNERPGPPFTPRAQLLTHSADRYADEQWWKVERPEITLGAPSWQWLALAFASCAALERRGAVEGIDTPLLILNPLEDKLVDPAATRRIAARLPDARIRNWGPESAHEILREADPVRSDALAEIDRFLDERAPAR
ncbi:alpha/beta fold hydrolase [Sphingomonas sanxanigenens]|uniref:Serine aminopeptidase S33 domain-containing protein n=1 Tax=Sphingomonas sanxanigenens DSM 19645 = NX02 TaxID=1123269 RepID=W0A8N0_9SPHN|nr:alpha/beta hydrolase [Sphingomonas sanxanigenens]AHE52688.1 hypothetical protein NX02_04730 [Sphingomonas sanxanigenens DSM 19645 = NX02]